jgi:murein L,D-transpeptidase YafK
MDIFAQQPYMPFWKTLKPGYDLFEKKHIPADYHIEGKDYAF